MNGSPLSKLEIDVMQTNELQEAVELAIKHSMPAIVVHPGIIAQAIITRGRANGKFKIISPVDWPKGDISGIIKFRGLSLDAIDADGFEIMIGWTDPEMCKKNIVESTDFIRNHMSQTAEIRFVFPTHNYALDTIAKVATSLSGVRLPSLVRTDINIKLQVSKANPTSHINTMQAIHNVVNVPIKICGNINDLRSTTACNAASYAVNLQQAKVIIKEFVQNADALAKYGNRV